MSFTAAEHLFFRVAEGRDWAASLVGVYAGAMRLVQGVAYFISHKGGTPPCFWCYVRIYQAYIYTYIYIYVCGCVCLCIYIYIVSIYMCKIR